MNLFDLKKIEAVHQALSKKDETLAVAESVTSGLLQAAFSQAEMASQYFQGGITVYNIGQKYRHLNVEPIHAQSCNCVSGKVSGEMALQVCELFHSQWGIGITGYATAVPESENKLFAFYSIAHNKKIVSIGKILPSKKENSFMVQIDYVCTVIAKLQKCLQHR